MNTGAVHNTKIVQSLHGKVAQSHPQFFQYLTNVDNVQKPLATEQSYSGGRLMNNVAKSYTNLS